MSLILLTLIAAVFSQVFGFLWHGPLFGKQWGMACGMSVDEMKSMKPGLKSMLPNLIINFVANIVYAFVLFNLLGAFGAFSISFALRTAAIVFVGFILPLTATNIIWNGRPVSAQKTMFGISFTYQLINIAIWSVLFALLA